MLLDSHRVIFSTKEPSLACHWLSPLASRKTKTWSTRAFLDSLCVSILLRNYHWHATGIRVLLAKNWSLGPSALLDSPCVIISTKEPLLACQWDSLLACKNGILGTYVLLDFPRVIFFTTEQSLACHRQPLAARGSGQRPERYAAGGWHAPKGPCH